MNFQSIGDQSRAFLSLRQNALLKADAARLSQEVASGKRVRPATPAAGDAALLSSLGRSRALLASYGSVTAEAVAFTDAAQSALAHAADLGASLGPALAAAGTLGSGGTLALTANDATARFRDLVQGLNLQSAGRSVFAGAATDGPALADGDSLLAALRASIAGETTAAGVTAAVDAWFDAPGGGFDTQGYQGTGSPPTFRTAEGETQGTGLTAADPDLRAVLKGFALAALIATPALATDEQAALARTAGNQIIAGGDRLTQMRASLGAVQARLDARTAGQSAEKTALDLAEARFTAADPYESATALQAVTTQLQTLYAMTARMSQLSLAEYLR